MERGPAKKRVTTRADVWLTVLILLYLGSCAACLTWVSGQSPEDAAGWTAVGALQP